MADTDLAELRKQCITSLYLCTENVSKYLDSEKEAQFGRLKSYVEGYCVLEAEQEVALQALERAKRETDSSNIDSLQQRFEKQLTSLAGKRLNVNNHPYMTELNKRIDKGLMQSRQNLDESDLAITEAQDQYIDPITKKPIVDPVKNTRCGHVYEREAIMNLINARERTKCPVVGCLIKDPVQRQHLVSDEELKFRITLTQHSTMIQERSILDLDSTKE